MEMVLKYRVQLATASRVDLSNLNSISKSLWMVMKYQINQV